MLSNIGHFGFLTFDINILKELQILILICMI